MRLETTFNVEGSDDKHGGGGGGFGAGGMAVSHMGELVMCRFGDADCDGRGSGFCHAVCMVSRLSFFFK